MGFEPINFITTGIFSCLTSGIIGKNETRYRNMPYIDAKTTLSLSSEQKEELKSEFGKLITTLNKPESYLMVSIEDSADLWFGGSKLEKGAFVAVSLLGNAPSDLYDKMTGKICEMLESKYDIPGSAVYVTYTPVNDWGWNGRNF